MIFYQLTIIVSFILAHIQLIVKLKQGSQKPYQGYSTSKSMNVVCAAIFTNAHSKEEFVYLGPNFYRSHIRQSFFNGVVGKKTPHRKEDL